MDSKEKETKKVSEQTQQSPEKPRHNKTREAVIRYRGRAKVNDPTLFYR